MFTTIQPSVCKHSVLQKPVTWMYLHHCGHPNTLLIRVDRAVPSVCNYQYIALRALVLILHH